MNDLITPSTVTVADAAKELLRRRKARANFIDFLSYVMPFYQADPVHIMIASHLERVLRGEIKRLMIFAPPQHGKSLLTSTALPAFWFAKRPNDPIIVTSYGADLATFHSRNGRLLLESGEYQRLFPEVMTDPRSRARDHWNLAYPSRGKLLAVGVGGPVTGHGALLAIIDDPFENWEQAQSRNERDRVWDWYRGTFRPRVREGGAIVTIATRWHEDDLAGRLLFEGSEGWTVLRFPALAETQEERDLNNQRMGLGIGLPDPLGRQPNEPLAPRRFSLEALQSIRTDVGPIVWGAEYQGSPRGPEGTQIKREWLTNFVDVPPKGMRMVRYWDKAGMSGSGDYTAGVLMGEVVTGGRWVVVNVIRGRWSAYERAQIERQTAELDGPEVSIWLEQEPGSGGKESAEASIRNLAGFDVHSETVSGSKTVRATPLIAQLGAGNVSLVRAPSWNGEFIEELVSFPFGAHDDQVDAATGAFNKLARRLGGVGRMF